MTPPPAMSSEGRQNKACVYLLRSLKDCKFYLGWTTDLNRRLHEHNMQSVQSTKSRIPFELVYCEVFDTPVEAKRRERQLKNSPNMYFHFKKRALQELALRAKRQVVG